MDGVIEYIKTLLGSITLTKSRFMGLKTNKIIIYVTPSLKVFRVYSKPESLLDVIPLTEGTYLNLNHLKKWAELNEYEISFFANIPKLKRSFFSAFGDVMQTDDHLTESEERKLKVIIDEDKLPDNIKKWAQENPEIFKESIERIKKLIN